MKKKILTLCLVVALAATAVIGGTLAYFTDTDTETNVFTAGDIKIDIEEIFPEKELMPGTATDNNLQKEVYVKNTGSNDAYMWIEVLIPAALDTPRNASLNDLHFNYYDTYFDAYGSPVVCSSAVAKANGYTGPAFVINEVYMGTTTIEGVDYNRYLHYTENDTAKATDEKTAALLAQVYMDKDIEQCTDYSHTDCLVLKDGTHYTGAWELIINAYGIQSQGFDTIGEAINAYYETEVIK
mgnify:CR=1 FL=1